jgi:hypothetical protein
MPESALSEASQQHPGPTVKERRGCERYRCHPAPIVRFVVRPFYRVHRAALRDISTTGVGLTLWLQLQPGTVLLVQLPGPGAGETHARLARVCRVEPEPGLNYRVGCRFASPLSAKELDAICHLPEQPR